MNLLPRLLLVALAAWSALALPARAQPVDPVSASAVGPQQPVARGADFAVELQVEVQSPFYVYGQGTDETNYIVVELTSPGAEGLRLLRVVHPPAERRHDAILDEVYYAHGGRFTLRAEFRVEPDAAPGPRRLPLEFHYQACDENGCLFPETREHVVELVVSSEQVEPAPEPPAASADAGSSAAAPPRASLQDDFRTALDGGDLGRFLWLAVLLGFVSLLTPCVFPMIPITVSFFSKQSDATGSGGRGVSYALVYGAGIIATYTGFGLGMALLLGASSLQSFATNPWTNLAIGALFVFFGLSLMGFYDLRPPAFLTRRAEAGLEVTSRRGYLPVLVMGFVFTITAFTCTAPIVGSLLAAATAGGSPLLIVTGMLAYSLAFALPFVLLAMFPGALAALPGAGGWMITVKVALGFIELVAALKFFSAADLVWDFELLSRPVLLTAAVLITGALTLYLFGTFKLPHDVPGARRRALSARTGFAFASGALCLYLASGLTGRPLDSWTESFLPPDGYAGASGLTGAEAIDWADDLESAQRVAAADGRLLFLDFTGVTCQNCRKVEKAIFPQPEFVAAMRRVVPVKLYTDRLAEPYRAADAANRRLMETLGSVTLPLYVLMAPDGSVLRTMGYSPDLSAADFVAFVEDPRP